MLIHFKSQLMALFVAIFLLAGVSASHRLQAQELDAEHIAEVLAALDDDVRVVEYEVESTNGHLTSTEPQAQVASVAEIKTDAFVRFEPQRRRYFVRIASVQHALTRDQLGRQQEDKFASESEFSNDLSTFRTWYRGSLGNVIPQENAPPNLATCEGIIATSEEESLHQQGVGFFKIRAAQVGLCWMPPFFWTTFEDPQPISSWLQSKIKAGEEIQVRKLEGDEVLLSVRNEKTTPRSAFDLDLVLDLGKGCLVSAEWKQIYHVAAGQSPTFKKLMVTNVAVNDRWLPQECMLVSNLGTPTFERWEYKDIRLNAPVTDDDFRVKFPQGVELTDFVEKKQYVTGASVLNDTAEVQAFVVTNNLEVAAHEPPTRDRRRLLILAAGTTLAVMIGIIARNRWKVSTRRNAAILVVMSLMASRCVEDLLS